jgi:cobyrinic acid a,c-diamide synthase
MHDNATVAKATLHAATRGAPQPRVFISAAHKSSGKTTLTLGLCAALRARGTIVQPFKKGPDYIDPMWLGVAAGRPCYNLDFHMMSDAEIGGGFARWATDADISLIEGNKGLYDGLDLHGSNSNAALAKRLGAPVVLVIDARGMTRGIAPLLLGYQAFDRDVRIAGVILNHVGGSRHEGKLRAVIEHYTDIEVLGAVPHDPDMAITERHLGLVPANEADAARAKIARVADRVAQSVDLPRLVLLAGDVAEVVCGPRATPDTVWDPVRIGIARDRAFGFYYSEDIDTLREQGAELIALDLITDTRLPELDGLIIGGGFPEVFMAGLEANVALRTQIASAIRGGLPTYAECGGLMYLSRSITWQGRTHAMVGVVEGDTVMHDRPVGRGYARLDPTGIDPWAETESIPAHEFHYSSLENLPRDARFAYRVTRGHGIDGHHDGYLYRNLLAAYVHRRGSGPRGWIKPFLEQVRAQKGRTHDNPNRLMERTQ